jgi:hypothetical protein
MPEFRSVEHLPLDIIVKPQCTLPRTPISVDGIAIKEKAP